MDHAWQETAVGVEVLLRVSPLRDVQGCPHHLPDCAVWGLEESDAREPEPPCDTHLHAPELCTLVCA
jgi:hypothetical protein